MFGALDNSTTGSHTEREWTELVLAWGSRCFYCARPVQIKPELLADELTKDHLIPLSRGGSDDIGNIVPACFHCNRLKGTMTIDEFREARPVFFTDEQNARRASFEVDGLGSDPHPALVQAVKYLAPKMSMDPSADPEFWKQRRALLRQQTLVIGRRNLESAGQLTLPIFGDGSAKKSTEAEAAALTVRKGLAL
jgi:HNH endonuclease